MRFLTLVTLCLVASPALAQDEPKMSKAEVDRVISTIKSDPAQLQNYCAVIKLQSEYEKADQQSNQQKLTELDQRMDVAMQRLGPDFDKAMSAELDGGSVQAFRDLGSTCAS